MDERPFQRLRDMDLSRDEVEKLTDALKKDEFKKLLVDYVKEVQDPENQKIFQKEMTQLEKERGVDITFINPQPCYVIKTSVNGSSKCFVNICGNDNIGKPSSRVVVKEGTRGLQWQLPHSLAPPRLDIDNKRKRCQIFDVVFHPDTLHLAHRNEAFKNMVSSTALDGVESNFDVKLDRKNLKFPKMQYKGFAHASVIRKNSGEVPVEREGDEKEFFDRLYKQMDDNNKESKYVKKSKKKSCDVVDDSSKYTTPKYVIKHRSHVDLQECTEHREAKMNAAIPKELVVEVTLPLLKTASDIILDVTEKTVQLISEKPAKYKLNLTLPYIVMQDNGNAKFDKDTRQLIITLPVKRNSKMLVCDAKEDSGVESDHGSPILPESDEETEAALVSEVEPKSVIKSDRTQSDSGIDFRTNFLDDSLHYSLPDFTCHVFDNTFAFTLHVKNVDENSIMKLINEERSSLHVQFVNISQSFYPVHYAFYIKLCSPIDPSEVTVEVWDNNVIVQMPVNSNEGDQLKSYFYGIDEDNLTEKSLDEPSILSITHEESNKSDDLVVTSKKAEAQSSGMELREEGQKSEDCSKLENSQTEAISIAGSCYESSGDELSCSFSPSKGKGILKHIALRKAVGRSVSESSLDDIISSSVENYGTSFDSVIPEDPEPSTSLKKTVRFNTAVNRQFYRSNSSILGQKKKNQRKARNKKRALERRHSESEASEVEDKKEGEEKTQPDSPPAAPPVESSGKSSCEKKEEGHIFSLEM